MKLLVLISLLAGGLFAQNPNTAAFPGGAATDSTLFVATNRSQTTLATTVNNSITTVVLTSGANFTAPVIITLDSEIVHCATLTTNTLTGCTRGSEGTSGASHTSGIPVYGFNSAWHHNQIAAEIKAIETAALTPTANGVDFTSQTSVTWTHNLGTRDVVPACYNSSHQWLEWDTLITTSTSVITVTFTASQTGRCIAVAAGSVTSYGALNTVSYSATPAFDLSLGWLQKITLTGDVTSSTVSNATTGVPYTFLICQDSTGGRLWVWPTTFHGGMTIGSTLSKCSIQGFVSDGSAYYATSPGVINQ